MHGALSKRRVRVTFTLVLHDSDMFLEILKIKDKIFMSASWYIRAEFEKLCTPIIRMS